MILTNIYYLSQQLRVSLDIDISYEEANFIKDTFIETYSLRDVTLVPVKTSEHEEDMVQKFILKL